MAELIKRAVIISRTKWNETPRIRHQLAYLLKSNGYDVTFIEKCHYFGQRSQIRKENGVVYVNG